jgi:hypothetical protein
VSDSESQSDRLAREAFQSACEEIHRFDRYAFPGQYLYTIARIDAILDAYNENHDT